MPLSARLDPGQQDAAFRGYYRFAAQRMERAALIATDRASREGLADLRGAMAGAGLGRLGNALGATSDLKSGKGIHRRGANGFSASGVIFNRSQSERTAGALDIYLNGGTILPRRGRWLWIPTDQIARLAGSNRKGEGFRLTPALWKSKGFDTKIGPLVAIKSVNGFPLLVVKNVGVALSGAARSAKSLTKKGLPRKGQVAREMIVAFIGIPSTSRAARIDASHVLSVVQGQMENYFYDALGAI